MKRHGFQRIGHRGRPGNPRYGENTILSFDLAFRAGANGIEYDVRTTKDGQLVIMHDSTLNRTTNGTGGVSDYTYKELCDFDAGYGERIPLFEDILYRYHERGFQNIEIKDARIGKEIREVLSGIEGIERNVLVSAFEWSELEIFQPTAIPTALLADKEKIDELGEYGFVAEALRRGAKAINPSFKAVTLSLVTLAHGHNLDVYVWTVNEEIDIALMKAIGVDGIISDFVERL